MESFKLPDKKFFAPPPTAQGFGELDTEEWPSIMESDYFNLSDIPEEKFTSEEMEIFGGLDPLDLIDSAISNLSKKEAVKYQTHVQTFRPGDFVWVKPYSHKFDPLEVSGKVLGYSMDKFGNLVYDVEVGITGQTSSRSGGVSYYDPQVKRFYARQMRK